MEALVVLPLVEEGPPLTGGLVSAVGGAGELVRVVVIPQLQDVLVGGRTGRVAVPAFGDGWGGGTWKEDNKGWVHRSAFLS